MWDFSPPFRYVKHWPSSFCQGTQCRLPAHRVRSSRQPERVVTHVRVFLEYLCVLHAPLSFFQNGMTDWALLSIYLRKFLLQSNGHRYAALDCLGPESMSTCRAIHAIRGHSLHAEFHFSSPKSMSILRAIEMMNNGAHDSHICQVAETIAGKS